MMKSTPIEQNALYRLLFICYSITDEKEVDAVWESNEEFCHIIVDADMFNHHLPNLVINAVDRFYHQKIQRKHKVPRTPPVHYSKLSDKQQLITSAVNPIAMEEDSPFGIGNNQQVEVEIHNNPTNEDTDIPISWL